MTAAELAEAVFREDMEFTDALMFHLRDNLHLEVDEALVMTLMLVVGYANMGPQDLLMDLPDGRKLTVANTLKEYDLEPFIEPPPVPMKRFKIIDFTTKNGKVHYIAKVQRLLRVETAQAEKRIARQSFLLARQKAPVVEREIEEQGFAIYNGFKIVRLERPPGFKVEGGWTTYRAVRDVLFGLERARQRLEQNEEPP